MRRPRAVLMDLDCTLTDRAATVRAFAGRFVKRFGADLAPPPGGAEDSVASAIVSADDGGHAPRARVFDALRRLPWTRPPNRGVIETFWGDVFPACTRPAAWLHAALRGLREAGLRLGIVSNGNARAQRRKIDVLGVAPFFDAIIISSAVGLQKPDPRIFRLGLRAVGAEPADCWFVGDHPITDILAARAAGMVAVWVHGGRAWPAGAQPVGLRIGAVCELTGLLKERAEHGRNFL